MEKAKMFMEAWAVFVGIVLIVSLWLLWPCTEEVLIWLPNNSQIKNPVEKGVFIPVLKYRAGESIIIVPFEQYIERFSKNAHEVFIQTDGEVWYATESGGMKFAAVKKYLSIAEIHETPVITRIKKPAIAEIHFGFSWSWLLVILFFASMLGVAIAGVISQEKHGKL